MDTMEDTRAGDWDEVAQRGVNIYEQRLKALLEPDDIGRFVAIHVETGDYAVARFAGSARRALHRRHPDGPLVVMRVGPEPEYGLSARLLASRGHLGK